VSPTRDKDSKRPDKPRKQPAPQKGARSKNALVRYFQETREELRKVSWPSREETWRLTLVVLGVTAAGMLFLGLLDMLFQRLAGLLI
jgi:preprotein translocase subunit SecE